MSNAKWRKLFAVIRSRAELPRAVVFKFVRDERLFSEPIPHPPFEYDDNFGEHGGISYAPFEEIDYVEIPQEYEVHEYGPEYPPFKYQNDIAGLVETLNQNGKFPIQIFDNGIRIIAYEW